MSGLDQSVREAQEVGFRATRGGESPANKTNLHAASRSGTGRDWRNNFGSAT